jgi:hypothetical protein
MMIKKDKYLKEVLELDVSMHSEYIEKLEKLMATYLNKEYVVIVSDIILMNPRVKELKEKYELFTFRTDDDFKELDSGFVISSDDKVVIDTIKDMTIENPDYQMPIFMVAVALAIVENLLDK